jgi:hypothetical protein
VLNLQRAILKLEDLEVRGEPGAADISGRDREAKLRRRDVVKQVTEGDGHTLSLLVTVDLAHSGCLFGARILGQSGQRFAGIPALVSPNRQHLRNLQRYWRLFR